MKSANSIFASLPTTIFEVMSRLAMEHGAVNLGQGFPDGNGPDDVRAKAEIFLSDRPNQYPPMMGVPELRQAVADHGRRFYSLDIDWQRETMVTSGATEALAAAFTALITPGDEVLLLQPLYDAYAPLVRRAGGVVKLLRLQPPHWRLDADQLAAAMTPSVRMVVFNNPLNPTGSVFSDSDLQTLAAACVRCDAIAVSDEVWDSITFDGQAHRPLAAYPGMRERTIKIGSAGKMFALTGWKVGFACGPENLLEVVARAHQYTTFSTPPNLQTAVAYALESCRDWFVSMPLALQRSRDRLAANLQSDGWAVLHSAGTYFLNLDLAASGVRVDDRTFCDRALTEFGVAGIPVSSFYENDPVATVVRLCFAKSDAVLDTAAERLGAARRHLSA